MKWACRRPAKCDGANFPLFRLGTILGLGSSFQITRNTKKRGNMYTHNQLVSYPFMAIHYHMSSVSVYVIVRDELAWEGPFYGAR